MSSSPSPKPGTATPVTIFATPKRFEGHVEVIQRNAIGSWMRLNPRPEILLFGTESGAAEIAREFGLRHIPGVQCNDWGTPLVSDLFARAESVSSSPALCYVNADILLFDDFMQAVARVHSWDQRFLMVGRRTDLDIKASIDFQQPDWAAQIRQRAQQEGRLQIARSIDYFAFARGLYPAMPPLAIGRFWWDNWLLWKARSLGAGVVDASRAVLVVHQNHDYSHTTYGPSKEEMMASAECIRNARLTCEGNDYDDGFFWRYAYTIDDATFKLTPRGIETNPRHLWKQVKRFGSRPWGMAKLARRALVSARAPRSKSAVAGNSVPKP
jgi:hypothetical protein